MSKTAFITHGDQRFNQLISSHLMQKGYKVHLHFTNQIIADEYFHSLKDEWKRSFTSIIACLDSSQAIRTELEQSAAKMGGLELFIHGNEGMDDEKIYEFETNDFGRLMTKQFRQMFLWNQHVGTLMAKQTSGQIIFPLISDTLYYLNYPSSPILNHGKISMMKCLAKELAPFDICVNALTLGYYDQVNDKETRKKLKKSLDIYALKPDFPKLEQMIPSLDILLRHTEYMISGQNIHIGAGVETSI